MEFDVENLNVTNVETALNNIDIASFNSDFDTIYTETKSTAYASVKPVEIVESLDLTEISTLKTDISTVISKINDFIAKVKAFDNVEEPETEPIVPVPPPNPAPPEDPIKPVTKVN